MNSVGILYDSTQNYTSDLAAQLRTLLQNANVTISAFTPIAPGADSYASEVATMAALNPDVIYAATYFPEGGLIAKAMFDQNVSARCVVDYASDDPGFITVAGLSAAMAADIVGVPSPADFPNGPAFVTDYENTFMSEPGTWSPYTYDSLNFLTDGVKMAGSFNKFRLKRILDDVTNWQGVTGTVNIDPATGNRVPATLVILNVNAQSQLVINQDWAQAVGFEF